jgi:hypothetical protein
VPVGRGLILPVDRRQNCMHRRLALRVRPKHGGKFVETGHQKRILCCSTAVTVSSGQRRHRRDERLLPGPRRARGRRWSTARPARRWRPASPMPARCRPATRRPGPGPGVPVKAIKWMLMQHSPLVIWPLLDPAMWRWGLSMLANCTAAPTRSTRAAWCPGRVQPRLPEGAARRDRHRLRRAHPGHAAAVPHAEAARRHRQATSRC